MMEWSARYATVLVPLALLLAGAIGYLIKRHVSGQAHIEDQESLERAIRLDRLLKSEGISIAQAKELRDQFRQQRGGMIKAEAVAIVAIQAEAEQREAARDAEFDANKISFADTTVGMNMNARKELDKLDAELGYAIAEFTHECTEVRQNAIIDAQEAWVVYRDTEGLVAGLLWEGGSGAALLNLARQIELTEQRLRDVRLAQAENLL